MTTIHELLERLKEAAHTEYEKGNLFERLMSSYLRTDPQYSSQFSEVFLWNEWHDRWSSDVGIDLIARESITGDYWAIQCKFFDPSHTLQKTDIDSFFTASGKKFMTQEGEKAFSNRMIVSTTDKWSQHAEEALEKQLIPVTRLRVQDLAESPIDWDKLGSEFSQKLTLKKKKIPFPHQEQAIFKVLNGFNNHDRGKLVMACGTGKTFVSLKIAESMAGDNGLILYLVPSISLLSQTLREWTAETEKPFHAFAVCSDTKVGRRKEDLSAHDLALPATTDPIRLVGKVKTLCGEQRMSVVFSTYQSISVVSEAQNIGLPEFDLVVCDEAHRTTGVTLEGEEESQFVRVHNHGFIRAKKRLYMTATPRIFADNAKSKAKENDALLCSMDDEELYGPLFYRLGFGEAVEKGLLSDYKVLVLAVDEKHVSSAVQRGLSAGEKELKLEDAIKIVGCWNGLAKRFVGDGAENEDQTPLRRAVAFSRTIKDSKHMAEMFQSVVSEYIEQHGEKERDLQCVAEHVDGTFNALQRHEKLDWLKDNPGENTCRILSNARCLSEGVDVPALDAVLFLNPRDSVVDVVQSVGRVMRIAPGKKYGYVILPIGVPSGIPPEEALRDNDKYRVVWQVLQALRAHDDRFNVTVNQIELNKQRPNQIQVIGVGGGEESGSGLRVIQPEGIQGIMGYSEIEAWKNVIYAQIVLKCGDRRYWEDWAKDVAQIAERHITRITALIEADGAAKNAFNHFLSGLQENINPSIAHNDAIEMLAQHLITRPVFDALFENYSFTRNNPVSVSMQEVLDVLEEHALENETETLQRFYESVRLRARGIDNAEGRQRVVIELYDKFFKLAFPKMSERLGIVYTPVEVVDFIIRSAEDVLREHFNAGLTDTNVHILDPFTGTGTFIVRLLQSGLICPEDLERKYKEELHANEIVLLAYYIAAINIEETYHALKGGGYQPFKGIVLTDTFQMAEGQGQKDLAEDVFAENNQRVNLQKKQDIRVILGNPPYSAKQTSANDNNQNTSYPKLDARIRETYAEKSSAVNKNSLYDSYKRALRWASDRIRDKGLIGFVTNGSFIDGIAEAGVRKTMTQEFSVIYCFNLRGNQRTSGELSKKEGGKIFGSGSRTPVAITLFIRNPKQNEACKLFYYDIGDYLSRGEKLKIIEDFRSINKIQWTGILPNEQGDWINQRSSGFDKLIGIEEIFSLKSRGVETNRDKWVYNFSKSEISKNMNNMIGKYNNSVELNEKETYGGKIRQDDNGASSFGISWSRSLKNNAKKGNRFSFQSDSIALSLYRPFMKQWLYFNRDFNEYVNQWPRLFPYKTSENYVILVPGISSNKKFSVFITNVIPDLNLQDAGGQCFPLFGYEQGDLYGEQKGEGKEIIRNDVIKDSALIKFTEKYKDKTIKKEDIFYYIYGILHSNEYKVRYESNLKKGLPRIPFAPDFWAFCSAGRELAYWHLNYETIAPWSLKEEDKWQDRDGQERYRVEKMNFSKDGKGKNKTRVVYNSGISISGIPLEAYEYEVNGKSAIEWVMERYSVAVDKDSGIINDPNTWSEDPRYIIDLLKRVVRVSMESRRIIQAMPKEI